MSDEAVETAPLDRPRALASLEAALAATPRSSRPYEHATLAYRLGLAHAETPSGDGAGALRRALAYYQVAADIFDPKFDPVEHGRVLNAAGAAHRGLGDPQRAARLFEQAAELLADRGRDDERAAILNNLGLARAEAGDVDAAVAACEQALALFDPSSDEGRRGRVAALHTSGMAKSGRGTRDGVVAALADYQQAAAEGSFEDAPYHHALVHHSIGVAHTALADIDRRAGADEADVNANLQAAVAAFNESLSVFTRSAFPYQHALAKHNLGRALTLIGDTTGRRLALACFEDAVAVLDPRLHRDAWRTAYESLSAAEAELPVEETSAGRAGHFAVLVAEASEGEREALLRERLNRYLDQADAHRQLTELFHATGGLGYEPARAVLTSSLSVVMELPNETLEVMLRAVVDAHRRLPEEVREDADRALDQAVGDALGTPQRIFVRDFLYSVGWERP